MSNIGYAVFGRPRGHVVSSNGLFKQLNLDGDLYLDNEHVTLDSKEQVIMLRRIPTDLNNLAKKDGYLVVLYEHGLQQLEDRKGGYIGSAICFKENTVDATKLVQGLYFLFTAIKKHVDSDNRFQSSDGDDWKVNLPDPNGKFGIVQNERLQYAPLQNETKNFSVQLTNIQLDVITLITHFCLNQQFHHVEYLYASNNQSVVAKLKQKGLSDIPYASFFNYTTTFKLIENKIKKSNSEINKNRETIKQDLSAFETEKIKYQQEINRFKNEGQLVTQNLSSLKAKDKEANELYGQKQKEINKRQKEIEGILKEIDRLQKEVGQLKGGNVKELQKRINELEGEVSKEQALIKKSISFVKILVPNRIRAKSETLHFSNNNDKLSFYETEVSAFKKLKKIIVLGLFVLALLLVSLFAYRYFKDTKEEIADKTTNKSVVKKTLSKVVEPNIVLQEIEKYKDKTDTIGLYKHQQNVYNLLDGINKGSISLDKSETSLITKRKWNYWELYYNQELNYPLLVDVCKKLNSPTTFEKQGYLFNILKDKESSYVEGCNFKDKNISQSLAKYLKSKHYVFRKVPGELDYNKDLKLAYFKLIIKELNPEGLNTDKVGSVKVLYIK